MIDRSGRGGVGETNAGGKPIKRMYPTAPPKKKSAISSLAGAMAEAVRTPSKLAGAGIGGMVSTLKRASKAVSGDNPYKK